MSLENCSDRLLAHYVCGGFTGQGNPHKSPGTVDELSIRHESSVAILVLGPPLVLYIEI